MKRALTWCVFVSLAACVKFDEPRAYRCNASTDCDWGWVCLSDNYCHSPDAGARVACDTAADCTGDWLCGQDHFCRDPNVVGPFPCEEDEQCGGGWRCSTERACVDFANELQPTPFLGAADAAVLISPRTTVGDWVRVAPTQGRVANASPSLLFRGAVVRGTTVELTDLSVPMGGAGDVFTQRWNFQLDRAPQDLAVLPEIALVIWPDGSGAYLFNDGRIEPAGLPLSAARVAPLLWASGTQGAFLVLSSSGRAVARTQSGIVDLGTGVIDVAAGDELSDGGLEYLVLRQENGKVVINEESGGGPRTRFTFPTAANAPHELRHEWGSLAVRTDDPTTDPSFVATYGVQTIVESTDGGRSLSPLLSCGGGPLNDFSLTSSDTKPVAVCGGGAEDEVVYTLDARGRPQAAGSRSSARSAGTSQGHLRQLPEGQLVFSPGIVDDFAELLPQQPAAMGVLRGNVFALDGRMVHVATPHGLVPALRTDPMVTNLAGFVDGENLTLLEQGVVVENLADGGSDYPFVLDHTPIPPGSRARVVKIADQRVLLLGAGDTLFAATEAPPFAAVAQPRARPSPGFRIDDWVLHPTEAGYVEGWAVASSKLFRVTASSETRWKSTEWPLLNRDAVGLLEAGPTVLVVDTNGEALALPSRVPVSEPLSEEVLDVASACQSSFLTTADGVFTLQPATDGGVLSTWQRLAHRALVEPKLFVAHNRVFAADVNGVVVEFPIECP